MPGVALDVAGLTDIGRVRTRNEDQFFIARLERQIRVLSTSVAQVAPLLPGPKHGTVLLVADGMGGGAAGDLASATAARTIAEYMTSVMPWASALKAPPPSAAPPSVTLSGVRQGLASALHEGDAAIREVARAAGGERMGTTTTIAYVQWPFAYVAHVGDSRCYLLRRRRLEQITTDHTVAEKLRSRIDFTIDETSPWHHMLWNALGAGEEGPLEPEVHRFELVVGDTLLLCSDGLTKHVDEPPFGEGPLNGRLRSFCSSRSIHPLTQFCMN